MKLEVPFVCEDGSILEQVCPNEHGVYLIFRVPNVARGIRGKNKGHVDEVLIVGVPWSNANERLAEFGIRIERKE